MPQTTPGWVNPALDADPSRWRFAPKRKGGWLAPGEPNPRTPQPMVLMPPGFDPQDRGAPFHIVVAVPGSPAPPDAITLTPETGEVYRPGSTSLPPLNLTNLSLVSGPPPAPTSVPGGPAGPPGAGPPPSAPPMPGLTPPGAGPMGMPPAGMPGNAGASPLPVSPGPGGGAPPMPPDGAALPPSPPAPSEGPLGQGQDVGSGADEGDDLLAMSPIARQARQLWTQLMVGSRLVGQPRPGQTALSLPPDPEVGAGEDVGVGQSPDEIYRMRQQALTDAVRPWVGTPYSWGGNSSTPNPNAPALQDWDNRGVDCSGLVTSILRGFGMQLPGRPTTNTYHSMATPVQGLPQPGDILMNDAKTHMALYIGGGQMVEAPDRGGRVQIVPVRQDLRALRLREEVPGLDAATLLSRQAAGLSTAQDAAQGPPPAPSGPRGLMGLAMQHGASPSLATVMAASALTESNGNPNGPAGDNGQSVGLYQMYAGGGAGTGIPESQRRDPDYSTRYMLQKEFIPAEQRGRAMGLEGENLATYIHMSAERPLGWRADNIPASLQSRPAMDFRRNWQRMMALGEQGQDLAVGNAAQVVPIQRGPTAGQSQVAQRGPTAPPPLEPSLLQRAQEAVSQLGERIAQAIEPPTAYAAETAPTGGQTPAAAPAPAAIAPAATPTPPTSGASAVDAPTGPGPNPLAGFSNAVGGMASGAAGYVSGQIGAAGPQYPSPSSWGVSNPQAPQVPAQRAAAGPSQPVNPGNTGGMAPAAPAGYTAPAPGSPPVPPPNVRDQTGRGIYENGAARPAAPSTGWTPEEALGDQRYQAALESLRRINVPRAAIAAIEAAPGDQKWALIQGAQDQYAAQNSPQVYEKDGYAFVVGPDGQPHQLNQNAQGQQIHSQEIAPGVTISQVRGSDPVMTRKAADGSIWQSAPDGSNPRMVSGPEGLTAAQQSQADEAATRNRLTERGQDLEDQRGRLPYSQETVTNARDRAQRESEYARSQAQHREDRATVTATDRLQAENNVLLAQMRIQGDIDLRGTPSQDNLDNLQQARDFRDSLSARDKEDVDYRNRSLALDTQKFERPYTDRTAEEIASNELTSQGLADRRAEAEQKHQEALLPYEQMTKAQQADADIARERLGIEGQRVGIESQRVGIEQQRAATDQQRLGLEGQRLQSDIEFRNRPDAVQLEHGALGLVDRRNGGFTLTRGAQPYEAGGNIITPPGSYTQLNYMPGAGLGNLQTTPVFNGQPGIGYAGMDGYSGPGAYSQQQQPQRGGWGGGGGWGVGQGQDTRARGWNGAAAPKAPGWVPPIDPRSVVGTGHRWGEHVSLEGTHHGVDLQAVRGTPVKSPEAGWVSNISYNPQGLGLQVEIRDPRGWRQQLSHLDQANVQMGQRVGAGQQVGQVGSTGASTGPHLDVRTIDPQGQRVNPTGWLGRLAHMPRADKAPTGVGADTHGGMSAKGPSATDIAWAKDVALTLFAEGVDAKGVKSVLGGYTHDELPLDELQMAWALGKETAPATGAVQLPEKALQLLGKMGQAPPSTGTGAPTTPWWTGTNGGALAGVTAPKAPFEMTPWGQPIDPKAWSTKPQRDPGWWEEHPHPARMGPYEAFTPPPEARELAQRPAQSPGAYHLESLGQPTPSIDPAAVRGPLYHVSPYAPEIEASGALLANPTGRRAGLGGAGDAGVSLQTNPYAAQHARYALQDLIDLTSAAQRGEHPDFGSVYQREMARLGLTEDPQAPWDSGPHARAEWKLSDRVRNAHPELRKLSRVLTPDELDFAWQALTPEQRANVAKDAYGEFRYAMRDSYNVPDPVFVNKGADYAGMGGRQVRTFEIPRENVYSPGGPVRTGVDPGEIRVNADIPLLGSKMWNLLGAANPLMLAAQAVDAWRHRDDPAPDVSQLSSDSAAPVGNSPFGLIPMGGWDLLPKTGWQRTPYLGDY